MLTRLKENLMKHHIKNKELNDLKKLLFELKNDRHKREREPVNILFKVNGKIISDIPDTIIINYGCVQTDRHNHIISSDDNSNNFYYRRQAEKDKYEYYHLTLDFKGKPQFVLYIINRDLKFNCNNDNSTFGLSWTALNGEKKELIINKNMV